ncbi:MAG: T9SS type A sorting domain-containing protein [Bacteroidetes bacterium]|nr:T9SS type A sorting domain-containing protein [Bacteroidota bacterium]
MVWGDSGCNYTSLANSPSIPAIQPFNIATIVTTPTLNNTPVVYPDGSGGTVTNICTSVGIESPVNDQLQETVVYPSPSNGNFVLEFTETILKGNVMIHNLIGEIIFETTILNASRLEVHLDQISSGIYFVKVYNGVKYDCLKISINKS